jgi:RimJ/RimL family protein N-acetyltransferase
LEFLDQVCTETSFLTFGRGEFLMSEQEESDYLEKCNTAQNCLYLLAHYDEKIIGALWFKSGNRPRTIHAGELGTAVLKEFWGYGVASALINNLIEWAKKSSIIHKINLRVRSDNLRAIDLYSRMGFSMEGLIKMDLLIDAKYYDNMWMGLAF